MIILCKFLNIHYIANPYLFKKIRLMGDDDHRTGIRFQNLYDMLFCF